MGKAYVKIFSKDNICEGSNIKDEAAAFVNRILSYGMILDDMIVDNDKIVVKYSGKEINNDI